MIKTLHKIVLISIVALTSPAVAQQIDSLQAVLDTARDDRKVKTLNELFRANLTADPVKALGYAKEARNLATEINDRFGEGQ